MILNTYKRMPLTVKEAQGVHIIDEEGKRYLDTMAGLAVNALGYRHPRIESALANQALAFLHISNLFHNKPAIRLAERLCQATGFNKVFYANSGAEAMEGALKLAKRWGNAYGKNEFISFTKAFHGRTLGALSITPQERLQQGFHPLLGNTVHAAPYGDIKAVEGLINDKTCALFMEPVQGEAGVRTAHDTFMQDVASLCKERKVLLVLDEIQTGIGRTGQLFAFMHHSIRPDVVVFAKAIGGGLPLGGFLLRDEIADSMPAGSHGTTFAPSPLSAALGEVVLEELLDNDLLAHVQEVGNYFFKALMALNQQFPTFYGPPRGQGLLLGLTLQDLDPQVVQQKMMEKGVLINITSQNVVRFLPPLIFTPKHVDIVVQALTEIAQE